MSFFQVLQREVNEKGEKRKETMGKHVNILYLTWTFLVVQIKYVKKLQQDIENDAIIKDKLNNLGSFLVCIFRTFVASVLFAEHKYNNSDLGHEQSFENEGYEND